MTSGVICCSRQSKIHLSIYLFSVYSLCCPYICQSWTWYSERQNFLVPSTSPNQSQVQTAKTGPSFIGPLWKTRLYATSECKTVLTNPHSKWHIHISRCWTHYNTLIIRTIIVLSLLLTLRNVLLTVTISPVNFYREVSNSALQYFSQWIWLCLEMRLLKLCLANHTKPNPCNKHV